MSVPGLGADQCTGLNALKQWEVHFSLCLNTCITGVGV